MFRRFALVLIATAAPGISAASPRVLVLPFENPARDPRLYWLTEGAAVLLTDELAARGVPAIRRDERLEPFERLQVPPIATLSRATVIRLGEVVGAGDVVFGSLSLAGDTLEVRARRIQIDSGRLDEERVEQGPFISVWSQDTAEARVALAGAYLAAADPIAARREVDRALVLAPDLAEAGALLQRLNGPQAPQPK